MKLNIKILKGILSVALAATITTSCFVGPVGAFLAAEGASQEVVEGVKNLNLKVDAYQQRLHDEQRRLIKLYIDENGNNIGNNITKIIQNMANKLKKLDGIGCSFYRGLELFSNETIYDTDDVKKLSDMLDAFVTDIDVLIDQTERIEVDYEKDEVFLRKGVANSSINLDENQNNEDKIKLSIYKVNKDFGKNCDKLNAKILQMSKFIENNLQNRLQKAGNSIAEVDAELFRTFNKKLEDYERTRSNFRDMKQILGIKGAHTTEIINAFCALHCWHTDGWIGDDKKIVMLSSKESTQKAVEQIDTAIREMNKFIDMKIVKMYFNRKEQIFACLNECINDLSARQNIIVSENGKEKFVKEAFVSSEAFKNINKEFTAAYLKLKPWMMSKGDEGNQLITEFKDLYLELLDLYTFNNDLSQNEFEAKVQEKVQNVRNKLNVIAEKCEY